MDPPTASDEPRSNRCGSFFKDQQMCLLSNLTAFGEDSARFEWVSAILGRGGSLKVTMGNELALQLPVSNEVRPGSVLEPLLIFRLIMISPSLRVAIYFRMQ